MADEVISMDRLEILDTIYVLGQSQGTYSRLYARLNDMAQNDPDAYEAFMSELESQHFKDPVDLILYLEE